MPMTIPFSVSGSISGSISGPIASLRSHLSPTYSLTLLLAALLLLASCSRATPTPEPTPPPLGGSCSLPAIAGDNGDDEGAIRALLVAEGELVVEQSIDALMQLWSDEARVVDAKNTPDSADDDQVWDGKDAIRNRYVRIVFPGAPTQIDHRDESITIDGDHAQVETTTSIGSEVSLSGDRWEMIYQDGCWYLASLTYNLEAVP